MPLLPNNDAEPSNDNLLSWRSLLSPDQNLVYSGTALAFLALCYCASHYTSNMLKRSYLPDRSPSPGPEKRPRGIINEPRSPPATSPPAPSPPNTAERIRPTTDVILPHQLPKPTLYRPAIRRYSYPNTSSIHKETAEPKHEVPSEDHESPPDQWTHVFETREVRTLGRARTDTFMDVGRVRRHVMIIGDPPPTREGAFASNPHDSATNMPFFPEPFSKGRRFQST